MKIILLFILISLISGSTYEININREIIYSQLKDEERFIKFSWNDFKINKDETITKVEVEISTKKIKIGRWQGEFRTSTDIEPFWYSTENNTQEINDDNGVIIWNVNNEIGSHILHQPDGHFLFTIWWIDCDCFTIDKITVYTN